MITATTREEYRIDFTDGSRTACADLPTAKGGCGDGFGPHDLLEAALATCIAMTTRILAAKHDLPLIEARCTVRIDRSVPDAAILTYDLSLDGPLSTEQEFQIRDAVSRCPVARTMTDRISIQSAQLIGSGEEGAR